ncbi:MAG: serine hydrolase [Gemmatimonadetes bacterium]|nr:serine hydrolase [Gemmatimonadota bacterium]
MSLLSPRSPRTVPPCFAFALGGVLSLSLAAAPPASAQTYWPGTGYDWERRDPVAMGLDAQLIQEAVDIAIAGESTSPRDLALNHQMTFGREPHGEPVGPFTVRGPQSGLVVYKGYIVAEWGDPHKVDMTFSVSKSFLSTTVGLAYDRGLIADVDDPVRLYMPPVVLDHGDGEPGDESGRRSKLLFESEHNRMITWDHLLRQTSDWEGTLWGKPEWADRPDDDRSTWGTRARFEPGTAYEYNDTRVNLLALAATSVWRRPLPEVLREEVMDPIGATNTWRWYGYDNSWITLDGSMVQVVSGGGHWGGGMHINAFDQARFGLFTMHRGMWNGKRILSEAWFDMATAPGTVNEGYGFMNFSLNTGQRRYERAPVNTWTHTGAGSNLIYVDPANELVIVARWIRGGAFGDTVHRVLDAMGAAAVRR